MSTNKHAQVRYHALDKCFGNHSKRYYIEDLIIACNNAIEDAYGVMDGVKKRQIFEDIKFMESTQGFSIKLDRIIDGHRKYYRYSDKNFSILKKTISDNEVLQIKKVLNTLSRFKGLPKFEWISETIARLDSGLGLSENESNTIEFDQNFYLKGLEFISPIYEAIVSQQTISINYRSFKFNQKQTFIVHPYFLKQYNNRWFMFGLNNLSKRIVNLALDRIVSIKNSKEKYQANSEINFNEYFEDVIGVTVNQDLGLQKIILEVDERVLPYIETKPLHGSQKIKKSKEGSKQITLEVLPNYELEAVLLSFGEGIKVLEPIELKNKLAQRIKKMNTLYN